jgi:hypothetical protein
MTYLIQFSRNSEDCNWRLRWLGHLIRAKETKKDWEVQPKEARDCRGWARTYGGSQDPHRFVAPIENTPTIYCSHRLGDNVSFVL